MNEKLKAVRAKIIEACPELLELSFGCEIAWTYSHALNSVARTPITKGGIVILPNHMLGFGRGEWVMLHGNKSPREIDKKELQILGHPITLEHVLKAIKKGEVGRALAGFPEIYIYPSGYFSSKDGDVGAVWQHLKPLHEQSPETIDFIGSVLGV